MSIIHSNKIHIKQTTAIKINLLLHLELTISKDKYKLKKISQIITTIIHRITTKMPLLRGNFHSLMLTRALIFTINNNTTKINNKAFMKESIL